jgi:V/A-type H+/Na+-transporting ATPase subunit C
MAAENLQRVNDDLYSRWKERYKSLRRRLPFDNGNFPYVTARVKARRGLLMPKETYDRFLQMDIPEIARYLGEQQYKPELLALGAQYTGVDLIEMAITRNLENTYTQIYEFSEGQLQVMVGRYLDRYDLQNIKTIIRAKVYGATERDLQEDLIPAGSFTREFLEKLAQEKDLDSIFKALEGTIYATALQLLGKHPSEVTAWAEWEDLVSRLYYSELIESVTPLNEPNKLMLDFIKREIDVVNLKTMLRAWVSKAQFDREIFLDGGYQLSRERLHEMLKMDEAQLTHVLSGYQYFKEIAENLGKVQTLGIGVLMRNVERAHLIETEYYSHIHPLSILPVLDYIIRKDREVQNIRIIARGKESHLPTETMRELLVI